MSRPTPYSNPVQHDREVAEADKAARDARAYARSRFEPPTDAEVAAELERRRVAKIEREARSQ